MGPTYQTDNDPFSSMDNSRSFIMNTSRQNMPDKMIDHNKGDDDEIGRNSDEDNIDNSISSDI